MAKEGRGKFDFEAAKRTLEAAYEEATSLFYAKASPDVSKGIQDACRPMFTSNTQAFREVALGLCLVRLLDRKADLAKPYTTLPGGTFSGRTVDERVVNPFLRRQRIPCTKGPYLSVFRRSVSIVEDTGLGIRDQEGYLGLLTLVELLQKEGNQKQLHQILTYLLWLFIGLREESDISLIRYGRLSLAQVQALANYLLSQKSGGYWPLALVVANTKALSDILGLNWEVCYQQLNTADKPSGASGDVSIQKNGETLLVMEVTERSVEESRVVETFETKIAGRDLPTYLFMVRLDRTSAEALEAAKPYFAQGAELVFLDIQDWIHNTQALIGLPGHLAFQDRMIEQINSDKIAKAQRAQWNDAMQNLVR